MSAPAAKEPRESVRTWPLVDRIGYFASWTAGIVLILIAFSILVYLGVKAAQFFDLSLIWERPAAGVDQSETGGFRDPLLGTVIVLVLSTLIALPLGVIIGIWLVEYGRPKRLARLVESGVEIVAGTPSVVLALFGLSLFSQQIFAGFSFETDDASVLGRSFFACSAMMSLISLPLIVASTREALNSIPGHIREASYALGKTKAATIRRILIPAARPGIGTGTALGMGRVAGDTAIVVLLLGGSLQLQEGSDGLLGPLRGIGSTLTSYVYNNSPAGEGLAPEKAYFAAFVLMIIVILLNFVVAGAIRGRREPQWR